MPCDYRNYPDNWKTEIRPEILERAQGRCEFCGVPNKTWVNRWGMPGSSVWGHVEYPGEHGEEASLADAWDHGYWWGRAFVVLTVAHLDHDTQNNRPDNLRALCQRCHLRYDAKHHAENARRTRMAKVGQLELSL